MMGLKRFAFMCALCVGGPAAAEDLLVFAAASLKGPLDAIVTQMPDVRVSYGGSGALARQVQQGAPADVILLASDVWMTALVGSGDVETPAAFASNRLVLIGPPGQGPLALTTEALLAALDGGRLAMGFTASVPAGMYGKEALITLGLWDDLVAHIAEVDNVRSALALVARGEAPLGIVYATDVQVVPSVSLVAVFPADSHAPISYWAAAVNDATHSGAQAFVDHLQSSQAQAILHDAGFCAVVTPCEGP